MIALTVLLMLVAMFWLAAALIGVVFKVTFALIGGLFSLIGAVFGLVFGGLVLLVIAPVVALAVLPFCLPLLLLIGAVWLIARASRRSSMSGTPATGH